uniref:Protodermal factor 1 n=1 Tax=Ananas comosus var. bracteatus TaxID=296719 RepID=A0A6V7QJU5_ANACO|nr:unnamed protein product [Ananas comosus var. bracteatus]
MGYGGGANGGGVVGGPVYAGRRTSFLWAPVSRSPSFISDGRSSLSWTTCCLHLVCHVARVPDSSIIESARLYIPVQPKIPVGVRMGQKKANSNGPYKAQVRTSVIMEKERRGRGSNKNPDCSTPTHTTPTPSYGTPTPSHGSSGGSSGGYSTPVSHPTPSTAPVVAPYTPTTPVTAPSTPVTAPSTPDTAPSTPDTVPSTPTISTPSPLIPVDPHFHYFTGTSDYWRSHPEAIWAIFGYWGTVGQYFGASCGVAFGKSVSLPDALANTRHDGIGALFREGTASFLNSIVNRNFPLTTQQVKDAFAAAVSSDGAPPPRPGSSSGPTRAGSSSRTPKEIHVCMQ